MKSYSLTIDGQQFKVTVENIQDGIAQIRVNGKMLNVKVDDAVKSAPPSSAPAAPSTSASLQDAEVTAVSPVGSKGAILSPLPGVVLSIAVSEGQKVKRGDKIAVLEAMKMENDILAECDGTVAKIFVAKGDSLLEGAKIALIEQ